MYSVQYLLQGFKHEPAATLHLVRLCSDSSNQSKKSNLSGFIFLGLVSFFISMASSMLISAENLALFNKTSVSPNGLGFVRSDLHGKAHFPKISMVSCAKNPIFRNKNLVIQCNVSASRPSSQPRFIQHKKEAFWFYRFLSIVYDHVINPGHWTEDMREDALEPADLNDRNMIVVDVGGGTGFTTLGIVKNVDAKNVTILDQSPHQLAKAKQKEPLKDCKIIEGDAENLPFKTDYADRYVSAGRYNTLTF